MSVVAGSPAISDISCLEKKCGVAATKLVIFLTLISVFFCLCECFFSNEFLDENKGDRQTAPFSFSEVYRTVCET